MSDRIRNVDTGTQNSDRISADFEHSPVRRSVNTTRHAAHDRRAASDKRSCQSAGYPLAIRRRVPGPYDRDPGFREGRFTADCKEFVWRVREIE
jgi:hypothetical protein